MVAERELRRRKSSTSSDGMKGRASLPALAAMRFASVTFLKPNILRISSYYFDVKTTSFRKVTKLTFGILMPTQKVVQQNERTRTSALLYA
jgi:hypothetical protein